MAYNGIFTFYIGNYLAYILDHCRCFKAVARLYVHQYLLSLLTFLTDVPRRRS